MSEPRTLNRNERGERTRQWLQRKLPEPVSWRLYLWFGWEIIPTPEENEKILTAVRDLLGKP